MRIRLIGFFFVALYWLPGGKFPQIDDKKRNVREKWFFLRLKLLRYFDIIVYMCAVSTSKFRGQFLSCYLCNDSGICLRATDNLNQIAYHHCPLFLFGFKQFSIDLGLSVLELYQICFSSQNGIDMGKLRLGSLHNQVTVCFSLAIRKTTKQKMEKEHFPGKKNEKPFLQIEFWIQIVNAILHFFPRFFDMHILLIFFINWIHKI